MVEVVTDQLWRIGLGAMLVGIAWMLNRIEGEIADLRALVANGGQNGNDDPTP